MLKALTHIKMDGENVFCEVIAKSRWGVEHCIATLGENILEDALLTSEGSRVVSGIEKEQRPLIEAPWDSVEPSQVATCRVVWD